MKFENDVVVVGGCGHVGLPLAIILASKNLKVVAFDTNTQVVATVNSGKMPFDEPGAPEVLTEVLRTKLFSASSDKKLVSNIIIETPKILHFE